MHPSVHVNVRAMYVLYVYMVYDLLLSASLVVNVRTEFACTNHHVWLQSEDDCQPGNVDDLVFSFQCCPLLRVYIRESSVCKVDGGREYCL